MSIFKSRGWLVLPMAWAVSAALVAQELKHSSPEALLKSFVEAVNAGRIKDAVAALHASERAMAESFMTENPVEGRLGFEVLESRAEGDWALLFCNLKTGDNQNLDTLLFKKEGDQWFLLIGFGPMPEFPAWVEEQRNAWRQKEMLLDPRIREIKSGESSGPLDMAEQGVHSFRFAVEGEGIARIRVESDGDPANFWLTVYDVEGNYLISATGLASYVPVKTGVYRFEVGGYDTSVACKGVFLDLYMGDALPEGLQLWSLDKPAPEVTIPGNSSATFVVQIPEAGAYYFATRNVYAEEGVEGAASIGLNIVPQSTDGYSSGWMQYSGSWDAGRVLLTLTNSDAQPVTTKLRCLTPKDLSGGTALEIGVGKPVELKDGQSEILHLKISQPGDYILRIMLDSWDSWAYGCLRRGGLVVLDGLDGQVTLEAGDYEILAQSAKGDLGARIKVSPVYELVSGGSFKAEAEKDMPVVAKIRLEEERKLTLKAEAKGGNVAISVERDFVEIKRGDEAQLAELSATLPEGDYLIRIHLGLADGERIPVTFSATLGEPEAAVIPENATVAKLGGDAVSVTPDANGQAKVYFEIKERQAVSLVGTTGTDEYAEMRLFRGDFPLAYMSGSPAESERVLKPGVYHIAVQGWGLTQPVKIQVRPATSIKPGETLKLRLGMGIERRIFLNVEKAGSVRLVFSGPDLSMADVSLFDDGENQWYASGEQDGDIKRLQADLEPGGYVIRAYTWAESGADFELKFE